MQPNSFAVIDLNSAHLMINADSPFMLILHKGENVIDSLKKFAITAQIKSASLSGIGALENVRLGYFNLATHQYQYKTFSGMYELISLTGNITKLNDDYIVHLHVALGGPEYQTISGHLDSATVGVTAEIAVIPFGSTITRQFNPDLQLNLIKTVN
jgi:predicted DNA-binding protein with PD1-like motif